MIVVARVAEQQDGGLRVHVFAVALPEHFEGVAVVAVAVDPHDIGFCIHLVDCFLNVFSRFEVLCHLVDAVDEDERSHFAELALNRVHEHQREASKCCDAARDVGNHHQLRLCWARILELRFGRHSAVTERVTHRIAEVKRPATAMATLACEPRRQFAGEWEECFLQPLHLLAAGVHEFHVFGQRFAQSLGHRFCPAISNETATNLCLDFFLELLDSLFVLVFRQTLLQVRHVAV